MRGALITAVLWATPVLACPVCGQAANEQGQEAYKFMSLVMSFLPLVAIGGIVTWVAIRVRSAGAAQSSERSS